MRCTPLAFQTEVKTKAMRKLSEIMNGNKLLNCCGALMALEILIFIQLGCALTPRCKRLGLLGFNAAGVFGVKCDLSRYLYRKETAVWMFANCTMIGKCTTEGCLTHDPGQFVITMYPQIILLYDHLRNNESRYVFSVCDHSQHLIAQLCITDATITSPSEDSPAYCSCADNNNDEILSVKHQEIYQKYCADEHENETIGKIDSTKGNNSDTMKSIPLTTSPSTALRSDISGGENLVTSTVPSRSSRLYISDNQDLGTPVLSNTLVIGIIVMVSAFAVVSSICTCYVSFRKNQQESFRPQTMALNNATSITGDTANVSTSVLLSPALAQSNFSCSVHSIANHCQMENEHVYEAPDVDLDHERPPLPSRNWTPILEKNGWFQQRDMDEQTFENPFYESYDKLKRRQLISLENVAKSAPDLYRDLEQKDTSNICCRTLLCHSVDNLRQILHNSLPCEIVNSRVYEAVGFSTMSESMENDVAT